MANTTQQVVLESNTMHNENGPMWLVSHPMAPDLWIAFNCSLALIDEAAGTECVIAEVNSGNVRYWDHQLYQQNLPNNEGRLISREDFDMMEQENGRWAMASERYDL